VVFDAAVQTLYTRYFNRTRSLLAALQGKPFLAQPVMVSRDTQTAAFHNSIAQTSREAYTQPARADVMNSDHTPGEYVMTGRADRYEPSEVFLARVRKASILIQSFWRRYRAQGRANSLRDVRDSRTRARAEGEQKAAVEREAERRYQLNRRLCPRSTEDFQLLYEEVAVWVRQQTFSIREAQLPPEARDAAFELLLEKETRLLQNIDLLKKQAEVLNRDDRIGKFFNRLSRPRRWQLSDGQFAEVMTPYTLRAKALADLYYSLEETSCFTGTASAAAAPDASGEKTGNPTTLLDKKGYTITPESINYSRTISKQYEGSLLDQRLDVLLQAKWVLKEFDCDLTREAISLIDREADILNRGRSQATLAGLRRRLLGLFLQFAETPEFNPATLELVSSEADLVYRPNTLPIVDSRSLSPVDRERLARIRMRSLREKNYSEVSGAREKMAMADTQSRSAEGEAEADTDPFDPSADPINVRLAHLNSPLRKTRRSLFSEADAQVDSPGVGIPLLPEEVFEAEGIVYRVEWRGEGPVDDQQYQGYTGTGTNSQNMQGGLAGPEGQPDRAARGFEGLTDWERNEVLEGVARVGSEGQPLDSIVGHAEWAEGETPEAGRAGYVGEAVGSVEPVAAGAALAVDEGEIGDSGLGGEREGYGGAVGVSMDAVEDSGIRPGSLGSPASRG